MLTDGKDEIMWMNRAMVKRWEETYTDNCFVSRRGKGTRNDDAMAKVRRPWQVIVNEGGE